MSVRSQGKVGCFCLPFAQSWTARRKDGQGNLETRGSEGSFARTPAKQPTRLDCTQTLSRAIAVHSGSPCGSPPESTCHSKAQGVAAEGSALDYFLKCSDYTTSSMAPLPGHLRLNVSPEAQGDAGLCSSDSFISAKLGFSVCSEKQAYAKRRGSIYSGGSDVSFNVQGKPSKTCIGTKLYRIPEVETATLEVRTGMMRRRMSQEMDICGDLFAVDNKEMDTCSDLLSARPEQHPSAPAVGAKTELREAGKGWHTADTVVKTSMSSVELMQCSVSQVEPRPCRPHAFKVMF